MFDFSFSTVYTTVLISNLLLALIILCFRSTRILINAGYKLLALFVCFTLLRFLLPYELPFTVTVSLPTYVSMVISQVRHPLFVMAGYEISVWTFLLCIWLIGIVINLIRYVILQIRTRQQILLTSLDVTTKEPYASLLHQICQERRKKNRFRVLTINGINTPMLYGIFTPCILIPENFQLSQADMYYTMVHEASHHFHHDLLIKQAVKLITILYWWNPLCYVLNHQIDTVLEMRVDHKVTASDHKTIQNYLKCLITLAEQAVDNQLLPKSTTMTLLPKQEGVLTMRFQMLINTNQKKRVSFNIALFLFVAVTYISSYLVIFEAHYASPERTEESTGQTEDNTYAILKENGTYDIYFMDFFMENVDSLDYYNSDIPVYTEKEITNEKD